MKLEIALDLTFCTQCFDIRDFSGDFRDISEIFFVAVSMARKKLVKMCQILWTNFSPKLVFVFPEWSSMERERVWGFRDRKAINLALFRHPCEKEKDDTLLPNLKMSVFCFFLGLKINIGPVSEGFHIIVVDFLISRQSGSEGEESLRRKTQKFIREIPQALLNVN